MRAAGDLCSSEARGWGGGDIWLPGQGGMTEVVRQGEGGDKNPSDGSGESMHGSGRNLNQSTVQHRRRGTALCWRAAGRWFYHLLRGSCCCALWITTDTLRRSCTWISVKHNEVVMLCISHSSMTFPGDPPKGVSQTSPGADSTSAGSFCHEGAAALLWAHSGSCCLADDPQFVTSWQWSQSFSLNPDRDPSCGLQYKALTSGSSTTLALLLTTYLSTCAPHTILTTLLNKTPKQPDLGQQLIPNK